MAKTALITGITGQDGAYLAQLLLDQGYRVVGAVRRSSTTNLSRLTYLGIDQDVELSGMDLLEFGNILRLVEATKPDEVYNLAAQSFVGASFEQPLYTAEADGIAVTRLLEAIRLCAPGAKFYQASTSEMFGKVVETPQRETTPFYPRSPYGVAKLYGHWMTVNYREAYGMHASSGILFNHESPLRGQEFVSRKITVGLAKLKHGVGRVIELGNLNAKRDWGFAGDYVRGMWLMLQKQQAEDFVLATGQLHSVRDFVEASGRRLGFDIVWKGSGQDERGMDAKTGRELIIINPKFYRPAEVDLLVGDSSKARSVLSWCPPTNCASLVDLMVDADDKRVRDRALTF